MPELQYTVFESASETGKGNPIQEGIVAIGVASAASAAITGSGRKRRSVRLAADSACYVHWGAVVGGTDPVALADGTQGRKMGPDISTVEYFDIEAGEKIAVIQRV